MAIKLSKKQLEQLSNAVTAAMAKFPNPTSTVPRIGLTAQEMMEKASGMGQQMITDAGQISAEEAANYGLFGKYGTIEEFLKKPGMKGGLGLLAAQLIASYAINKGSQFATQRLQTQAVKRQTENMSAEDMLYQAMMPDLQARSQLAREALMSQLGGVHGPSLLASGESFVGK